MRLSHHGRTEATDLILSIGRKGCYLAVGRFDAGMHFKIPFPRDIQYSNTSLKIQLLLGPVDIMWLKRDAP
jgi:hypothetical protein